MNANEKSRNDNSRGRSVSFGSERIMRFKNKQHKTLIDFKLEHNSIINMVGGCQDIFQHSIIQNKKINGKRISLTFRKVICPNNIMEAKPDVQKCAKCPLKQGCKHFAAVPKIQYYLLTNPNA